MLECRWGVLTAMLYFLLKFPCKFISVHHHLSCLSTSTYPVFLPLVTLITIFCLSPLLSPFLPPPRLCLVLSHLPFASLTSSLLPFQFPLSRPTSLFSTNTTIIASLLPHLLPPPLFLLLVSFLFPFPISPPFSLYLSLLPPFLKMYFTYYM